MILRRVDIADDPGIWEGLGFAVQGDRTVVGGVEIVFGETSGFHIEPAGEELPLVEHPNGVIAVDHVVAVTGDFEAALKEYGEPRRIRQVPDSDTRQAFYVLGTALLELAGPVEGEGPPRFWGLTLVASDLDALAERLGEHLGTIRDAVQPGRRIATLRREVGSSIPIAFMTPRS